MFSIERLLYSVSLCSIPHLIVLYPLHHSTTGSKALIVWVRLNLEQAVEQYILGSKIGKVLLSQHLTTVTSYSN